MACCSMQARNDSWLTGDGTGPAPCGPLARGAIVDAARAASERQDVCPTTRMQKATHNPILYSLISGCVWAVIGFAIAWSVSPIRSTPTEMVRSFAGGLVAAP